MDHKKPEIQVPISGKNIVKKLKRPKISTTLMNSLYDPNSIDVDTNIFDIVPKGAREHEDKNVSGNASLMAMKNQISVSRPQTGLKTNRNNRENADNKHERAVTPSILSKRPQQFVFYKPSDISHQKERIIQEEMKAIAFSEDPISYFSKHKDGKGHIFIYLNHIKDRNDMSFNPYEIAKTTFSQLKQEHFTMSASGVTHVLPDGTTSIVSLDQWANESSIFNRLRMLKVFNLYLYWKPFRIWRVFNTRRRYDEMNLMICSNPIFTQKGFFEAKMIICQTYVDLENKLNIHELLKKYLLSFQPQSKYGISTFMSIVEENNKYLSSVYDYYIDRVSRIILELDKKIRDPKLLYVKDSDVPFAKRRNPNLNQLMVLEKKKAVKRVKLTEKVNEEILKFGDFIRSIDYYLIESVVNAVLHCWNQAIINFSQNMASIFTVEVSFDQDGHVLLIPSCDELVKSVKKSFNIAQNTINSLPRLLLSNSLRPHIKQSYKHLSILAKDGPQISTIIDQFDDIRKINDRIESIIVQSYEESEIASNPFADFYPLYQIEESWKISNYIMSRSGDTLNSLGVDHESKESGSFSMDFSKEPVIDLKMIRKQLELLDGFDQRLQQLVPCSIGGSLYIDSKGLRKKLEPIPVSKSKEIFDSLKFLLNGKVYRIKNTITSYSKKLKQIPENLDTYITFCIDLDETQRFVPKIEEEVKYTDELYHLFVSFHVATDSSDQTSLALHDLLNKFAETQKQSFSIKTQMHQRFLQDLTPRVNRIENKLNKYYQLVIKVPRSIDECNVERMINQLSAIYKKICVLKPEIDEAIKYQDVMSISVSDFQILNILSKEITFTMKLYESVGKWVLLETKSIRNAFTLVNMDSFSEEIIHLESVINDLVVSSTVPIPLLSDLQGRIQSISPYLTQLQLLATSEMQERHWLQLFSASKQHFKYRSDIRLDELLMTGILQYFDSIEKITDVSKGERRLELEFLDVKNIWSNIQLPLMAGQVKNEESVLIADVSLLQAQINDSIIYLSQMVSNPFAMGVRDQVVTLLALLENSTQILCLWVVFQKNWIFLRSLFNHEGTKSFLQTHISRYNWVKKRWSIIVKHVFKDSGLLNVVSYPDLYSIMKDNCSAIDMIIGSLSPYVETKICSVPRLFCLGTNDIISLMSFSSANTLNTLIPRLFMKCIGITICDGSDIGLTNSNQRVIISSLIGNELCELAFVKPFSLNGSVEHWVPSMVEIMKSSVLTSLQTAFIRSEQASVSDWIISFPSSISLSILSANFFRKLTEALFNQESFSKEIKKINDFITWMQLDLIKLLRSPIKNRGSISSAILLINNEIELIKVLLESNDPQLFMKQMPKHIYDTAQNKSFIEYSNFQVEYGLEFWGEIKPFIYQTNNMVLMRNIISSENPYLTGSPKSGRKTLIEDIASFFGKFLCIMNVYDGMNRLFVKRFALNAISSGSWLMIMGIDSFNDSCLSVLLELLLMIQQSKFSYMSTINYEGKSYDISNGYKMVFSSGTFSRSLNPDLFGLLKPISIQVPCIKDIIQVKLVSKGFSSHSFLASKLDSCISCILSSLFSDCIFQSKLIHSFRIIEIADSILSELTGFKNNILFENDRSNEEYSLARSSFIHFSSQLCEKKHQFLLQILFNSFHLYESIDLFRSKIRNPGAFINETSINALASTIATIIPNTDIKEYLINQTLSFHEMLQFHNFVIIYGPPLSGKHSVLNYYINACNSISNNSELHNKYIGIHKVDSTNIYHRSENEKKVFGYVSNDPTLGDVWHHGIINSVLFHHRNGENENRKFIVFNGPIDNEFDLFLSQVCSREFSSISSYDAIHFNEHFKFICIVSSLECISPSTLSSCAILKMENIQCSHIHDFEIKYPTLSVQELFGSHNLLFENVFSKTISRILSYFAKSDSNLCFSYESEYIHHGRVFLYSLIPKAIVSYIKILVQQNEININHQLEIQISLVNLISRVLFGLIEENGRTAYDQWIRQEFDLKIPKEWKENVVSDAFIDFFPRPSIYSFYFSHHELLILDNSQLNIKLENYKGQGFEDVIIPTPEFIFTESLLSPFLLGEHNVLLYGCTGIRSFIQWYFKKHSEFSYIFVPVGCLSSTTQILTFLQTHTRLFDKHKSNSDNLILIFENIEESSFHVSEFIRMAIQTQQIMICSPEDEKILSFAKLQNFSVIVTTKSIRSIDSSLLCQLFPVYLPEYCLPSLMYITSGIMIVNQVPQEVITNTISLFHLFRQSFPAFPTSIGVYKSIIFDICQLEKSSNIDLEKIYGILLFNITMKFPIQTFDNLNLLFEIFKNQTGYDYSQVLYKSSHMVFPQYSYYNDILLVNHSAIEKSKLEIELIDSLRVYNSVSSDKIDLKVFDPVIRNYLFLKSIFSKPGESVVLIGENGNGKYSLSRITANICQCDFIFVDSNNISVERASSIIRDIVLNCALMSKRCVLFVKHNDDHFSESMKVLVHFAKTKAFFDVFPKDTINELYTKFSATQIGSSEQRTHCWKKIIKKLSQNTHFVFSFDKKHQDFFWKGIPVLSFNHYNHDELLNSASQIVHNEDIKVSLGIFSGQIPYLLVKIHEEFKSQFSFCHLNNFFDFLDLFSKILVDEHQNFSNLNSAKKCAVGVISSIEEDRKAIDKKLDVISPTLQRITLDADSMGLSYKSRKESADSMLQSLEIEKETRLTHIRNLSDRIESLSDSLEGISPKLLKLQSNVEAFSNNDIETLRINASNPSPSFKRVFEVISVFLGLNASYEKGGVKLLNDNNFLSNILRIHFDSISPSVIKQVLPYFQENEMQREEVEKVSPSLLLLYDWITTLCHYSTINNELTVVKKQLTDHQQEFDVFLNHKDKEILSIHQILDSLEKEYKSIESTVIQRNKIEADFTKINSRKINCDQYLKEMEQITDRWILECSSALQTKEIVITKSLFLSFYLTYCGSLSMNKRKIILSKVEHMIKESGLSVPSSKPLSIIRDMLINANFGDSKLLNEKSPFYQLYLPLHHIDKSPRVPLIIDKDGMIEFHFKQIRRFPNVVSVSSHSLILEDVLISSIQDGKTLLVFDFDYLNDSFTHILSLYHIRSEAAQFKSIAIGNAAATWNPEFRLLLFTNHKSIKTIPNSIIARTTVINCSHESIGSIKKMFSNTIIEYYEEQSINKIIDIQKSRSYHRVNKSFCEKKLVESYADIAISKKNSITYEYITDNEAIDKVIKSKESYFFSLSQESDFIRMLGEHNTIIIKYSNLVNICFCTWYYLSRYSNKMCRFYQVSSSSFIQVILSTLKTLGAVNSSPAPEQLRGIETSLWNQCFSLFMPHMSYIDSIVSMFFIGLLYYNKDIHNAKQVINMIMNRLISDPEYNVSWQPIASITKDPQAELKSVPLSQLFIIIDRFLTHKFGSDYYQSIPTFQIENTIVSSPNQPIILYSNHDVTPSSIFSYLSGGRSKVELFEHISLYECDELLKRVQKYIRISISKGIRIFVHCLFSSGKLSGFIFDIIKHMQTVTVHSNFRIIFLVNNVDSLSSQVLLQCKRFQYDSFPSYRNQMMSFYHSCTSIIKSPGHLPTLKKISYGIAMLVYLIRLRDFIHPIGFNNHIVISDLEIINSVIHSKDLLELTSFDSSIRFIREYLQDFVLGAQIIDQNDLKKLRILVSSIIHNKMVEDGFTHCGDLPDSRKFLIPSEIPINNYISYVGRLPSFISLDGLMISRNIAVFYRVWSFSRQITQSLLKIHHAFHICPSFDDVCDTLHSTCPDFIKVKDNLKNRSLIDHVLLNEIKIYNEVIKNILTLLSSKRPTSETEDIIKGIIPSKWKIMVHYYYSNQINDFFEFMLEKKKYLKKWIDRKGYPVLILKYIVNAIGFLNAFLFDECERKGLQLEKAILDFDVAGISTKTPKNSIEISGLYLIGGSWSNATCRLLVDHTSKPISVFPNLQCSVAKSYNKQGKYFLCPLYRTIYLYDKVFHNNIHYTDGVSDNFFTNIPIPSDQPTNSLISNGTMLVCAIPSQIEPLN